MKKIEAIIRPEAFQALRQRLDDEGIGGLTVSEVAGCGQQQGQEGIFRGSKFEIKLYPKVKVELVVDNDQADTIIDIILSTCSTDQVGDGKIFVSSIEEVYRIRTGEQGRTALI
ncbi:P-II family nitrogen regulator [Thalassobacillus hwangdonensis]|uniref:P-II family nitrogen regulator n=1 Tax=Thalassobacillus hwangdonensis TaxID=546108 RepID=A0ABW3L3H4_9BACI